MPSLRSLQTRARFRAVVAADVLARSAGALQRDEDLSPRAEDRAAASAWRHIELPEGLVHPVWRTPVSVLAVLPHAWRDHGLRHAYGYLYSCARRVRRLVELAAPESIIEGEVESTQRYLDALFFNPAVASPLTSVARAPCTSLAVLLAARAAEAASGDDTDKVVVLDAVLFAAGVVSEPVA